MNGLPTGCQPNLTNRESNGHNESRDPLWKRKNFTVGKQQSRSTNQVLSGQRENVSHAEDTEYPAVSVANRQLHENRLIGRKILWSDETKAELFC